MAQQQILDQERSLPDHSGKGNVVQWHVYRTREEAEAHMQNIRLAADQHLVGGYSRDSIGPLWWLGVQVDDLQQ